MSKKKTKAQIIEGDNKKRYQKQEHMKPRSELSDLCRDYLEKKELFRWFIERYFGLRKYIELWDLAEADNYYQLRNELQLIWEGLPSYIFNLQVNPEGWESFVSLIEE